MYIRYFARTDETGLGRAAAAYCDVLVATGIPVRLVSTRVAELQVDRRGRSSSVWDRHRDLLVTPMNGGFVNVVCGEPPDWTRFHTTGATNALLIAGSNLLPEVPQPVLMEAATLYRLVFAQSEEVADIMERVTGYRPFVATVDELKKAFAASQAAAVGSA